MKYISVSSKGFLRERAFVLNCNEIISEWQAITSEQHLGSISICDLVIKEFLTILEKRDETAKRLSNSFHFLDFFKIGETIHSKIIADLLNPKGSHGQKNLFLKHFLEMMDIEQPSDLNWTVTAEKERVDILIKRNDYPHSVIIIENKSNNASDQVSQLYRYWYREIYLEIKDRTHASVDPIQFFKERSRQYKIIYLAPDKYKMPSKDTLNRPLSFFRNAPPSIPDSEKNVKTWYFNDEIKCWLQTVINSNEFPQENETLRVFINQYLYKLESL